MIAPKKKVSKQRKHKRRSSVWKLDMPGMVKCPNCGETLEFSLEDDDEE